MAASPMSLRSDSDRLPQASTHADGARVQIFKRELRGENSPSSRFSSHLTEWIAYREVT